MAQIMIVEDDFRFALMLEAMVESHKLSVVRATTGKEALRNLANHNIKLIILDVMLPELDGVEVTKAIRNGDHNHTVPIIAISAQADTEKIDQLLSAGCNDFLSKPFDVYHLQQKVLSYLA